MAYRDIPHDVRVKSTKEVVVVNPDIDEIAENYGVSVSFLKRQFEKVHDNIEETIEKDKPGPKSDKETESVEPIKETKDNDKNIKEESKSTVENKEEEEKEEGRPDCCNKCGSSNIVKNGRYSVKNHLSTPCSSNATTRDRIQLFQRLC